MVRVILGVALIGICSVARAQPVDLAAAFGAREGVSSASLSPDGRKIALVVPGDGQATQVFIFDTVAGGSPKRIMVASGKPERIRYCQWVATQRLACTIWGLLSTPDGIIGFSSIIAVDDSGANQRLLSTRRGTDALYADTRGGNIIDLLPDEDGSVLMMRSYVPEQRIDRLVNKTDEGMGVDQIDTRTGAIRRIENPRGQAVEYITDGRGAVRIMGTAQADATGYSRGKVNYLYRAVGQSSWLPLSVLDGVKRTGFNPYAIDHDKNVVYGFEMIDGRRALVSITLDEAKTRQVLLQRPDVDVDSLVYVGRRNRVVGAGYDTDRHHVVYFDPAFKARADALSKVLGGKAVYILDTSVDESRLLLWAGSDADPGQYYLFDQVAKRLSPLIPERPQLDGVTLATVQSVSYRATDGTMIPAYLTLPPSGPTKNLPAIVLPHGGPEARDYWGFDWLSQFFAAKGFAVIQPQFRGSAGYGQGWLRQNGFKSWRTSVGDVADAGRWLVAQGYADPARLGIFGWSYGGYAALQSTVLAPGLFKAAVAVAPVTDFGTLLRKERIFSNYYLQREYIGSGPHIEEGSPARNVSAITVPVLMFQGTLDANVPAEQARLMDTRLRDAGKSTELVMFEGLDHQLEDADARRKMLERSAAFLLHEPK